MVNLNNNNYAKKAAKTTFVLAHGAGANKDSDWMLEMDRLLSSAGINIIRFDFPYMIKAAATGKRRPPDRMPALIEAFAAQIKQLTVDASDKTQQKIFIGGKSMGGRVASLLASELGCDYSLDGVICYGFPFHPPKKLDKYRGEHLAQMPTPTLILQGERDLFGTREEIASYCLSQQVETQFIPDGDHSFKPRVRSGFTLEQNLRLAANLTLDFMSVAR